MVDFPFLLSDLKENKKKGPDLKIGKGWEQSQEYETIAK